MGKEYHVLVVEDDKEILEGVRIYLKNQGYVVFGAGNGQEGLEIMERETIHLAIVDVMMPVMDGITMTMRLREKYDFPVIMLTAKSEEIDKITGLNVGADDYVTKPFAPMELLARVNSQLRRYSRYLEVLEGRREERNETKYVIGGLELDEEKVSLTVDGEPVKLTPMEFKILTLLMKHPGRVFSADELYERIWNEKAITTDTIMVHVRRIREKIEIDPKNPRYLKVVWGVGYKMEDSYERNKK
ncbi:MAG: response regulator transcription factor [Lachnospiraceae bacterium]|nr:response regulator transcription factor [Lachnospiraceae bacterium]